MITKRVKIYTYEGVATIQNGSEVEQKQLQKIYSTGKKLRRSEVNEEFMNQCEGQGERIVIFITKEDVEVRNYGISFDLFMQMAHIIDEKEIEEIGMEE